MILCCGEALIDMLPRETTANEPAFSPYAGGAVFNTAIALGRLGAPTGFFCGLSNDLFGQILVNSLNASNVRSEYSIRSDRPTTLAFVTLNNGQAKYAFYDENTAMRLLTPADLPALPESIDALFFGGISLVGEPCGDAFAALLAREADYRAIILDPNIRPGFIQDEGRYRARLNTMLAQADIVKLSDEDLHWLVGDGDIPKLVDEVLSMGPKFVVVTEGAEGARGFTKEHAVKVASQKVVVADTVGAGDTFNAGVLVALYEAGKLTKTGVSQLDPATIEAALSLGGRSAAVTVSRAGANPPWRAELS
jgi:fructokinase